MIVYSSTKKDFLNDVLDGYVEKQILTSFVRELGHSTGKSEIRSWKESMQYMSNIMHDPEIPDDVGVAIEYKIPRTSKRIDFIITGKDDDQRYSAVVIELKQWSEGVEISDKDGVLNTKFFGEVPHPSYQAWSYTTLLEDYNENVQKEKIQLKPCAYLHNYEPDNIVLNDFYKSHIENAPIFLKPDAKKLQSFIKKFVKYGDNKDTLFLIENGRIRPSKNLADSLLSMLEGKKEFTLIDDQKVVYETALSLAEKSDAANKNVLIVEGGPGTGKSVVAINLLTTYTQKELVSQYITRNSAPREVYQIKLTGKFTKTRIANLFSSSGSFYDVDKNTFDALVIDEAHRLTEKSGMFSNLGENQVKELINAAKFSVFFIDEEQQVTIKDVGTKELIKYWAKKLGVNIHELKLESQFRCNGSDGYLAWLDEMLQIRDTANDTLEGINYDFKVFDDLSDLYKTIIEKNKLNNKSRMVSGYCWNWISKKNPELNDFVIGDFTAKWNLNEHGQSWIIRENSVEQVGCIHTCQGLELDYIGVIVGPDLVIRNGKVITDFHKRASTDQSLKGLKTIEKNNPDKAQKIADRIIKNTYRTLMTRGMKGCYIYSTDEETKNYFIKNLETYLEKQAPYCNVDDGASLNVDE
jgi:uncharacterized protein